MIQSFGLHFAGSTLILHKSGKARPLLCLRFLYAFSTISAVVAYSVFCIS